MDKPHKGTITKYAVFPGNDVRSYTDYVIVGDHVESNRRIT